MRHLVAAADHGSCVWPAFEDKRKCPHEDVISAVRFEIVVGEGDDFIDRMQLQAGALQSDLGIPCRAYQFQLGPTIVPRLVSATSITKRMSPHSVGLGPEPE